jgi:arginyl-tRNA synthetase
MMQTPRSDTPLDFDFTKVVEASKDNPVFYVQYAHARISSLKRKAADAHVDLNAPPDLSLLDDEELALVKRAAQYSRVLEGAAMAHEPHRVAFFLYDLAAEFHALWNRGNDDPERRFLLENNPQLSRARLELALGIAQIIRSGLSLMGVTATEEMR